VIAEVVAVVVIGQVKIGGEALYDGGLFEFVVIVKRIVNVEVTV
jgi:hypothetical protein